MPPMAQDQSTENGVGEAEARFSWVAGQPAGRNSGQATRNAARIIKAAIAAMRARGSGFSPTLFFFTP